MVMLAVVWSFGVWILAMVGAYVANRTNERVQLVGMMAVGFGILALAIGSAIIVHGNDYWWLPYGTVGKIVQGQLVITWLGGAVAGSFLLIAFALAISHGAGLLAKRVNKKDANND